MCCGEGYDQGVTDRLAREATSKASEYTKVTRERYQGKTLLAPLRSTRRLIPPNRIFTRTSELRAPPEYGVKSTISCMSQPVNMVIKPLNACREPYPNTVVFRNVIIELSQSLGRTRVVTDLDKLNADLQHG